MAVKKVDKYANMAYLAVLETAPATLTFAKLQIATQSLMDVKYGLLINRLDIEFSSWAYFNSTADGVSVGLTVSDGISDLSLERPEVLVVQTWGRLDYGAAATGQIVTSPVTRDFSTMPGTGILVPADRLFIGILDVGASSACRAWMRLYYTTVELTTEDYWQLVESRSMIST